MQSGPTYVLRTIPEGLEYNVWNKLMVLTAQVCSQIALWKATSLLFVQTLNPSDATNKI